MNKKLLVVQSISDVITNSSSELFIVNKEDMLHYVEKYDKPEMDCFEIEKLTWNAIKSESWMSYDVGTSSDTRYELVLPLLRMTEEDAMKEGVKFFWQEYERYDNKTEKWLVPIDEDEKFFGEDWKSPEKIKERKKATKEFHDSWVAFCKKHHEEIKEKVIGNFVIEVEDHFNEWPLFKEEINKRGWLFTESHH